MMQKRRNAVIPGCLKVPSGNRVEVFTRETRRLPALRCKPGSVNPQPNLLLPKVGLGAWRGGFCQNAMAQEARVFKSPAKV
jgi:hypothetical protein